MTPASIPQQGTIGLLPASSLGGRERGRKFFKLLENVSDGRFLPEFYGDHEPLTSCFDIERVDEALDRWQTSFFWRRRKPRSRGAVFLNHGRSHDSVTLHQPLEQLRVKTLLELFGLFQDEFGLEIGYVHVAPDEELADLQRYRRQMALTQVLTTKQLREGLPDLPWLTVFGPNYRAQIQDRLPNAPAYQIEELGQAVWVQLTERPSDPFDDFASYARTREEVKSWLGGELFMGNQREREVPNFWFEDDESTGGEG